MALKAIRTVGAQAFSDRHRLRDAGYPSCEGFGSSLLPFIEESLELRDSLQVPRPPSSTLKLDQTFECYETALNAEDAQFL
jgi:hypothetical protein